MLSCSVLPLGAAGGPGGLGHAFSCVSYRTMCVHGLIECDHSICGVLCFIFFHFNVIAPIDVITYIQLTCF